MRETASQVTASNLFELVERLLELASEKSLQTTTEEESNGGFRGVCRDKSMYNQFVRVKPEERRGGQRARHPRVHFLEVPRQGRGRNVLTYHVLPVLRKLCRDRAVEFVEVDLRWGVTEEQAQRKEVVRHCLA
jgi:hypothetical protein